MSNNIKFSKKAVNRAGERLVVDPTDEEALEVLDYWRGLHAEAPDIVAEKWAESLQEKRFDVLPEGGIRLSCKVISRLKRSVSIIEKLKRMQSLKLSRMQDIAGIRCIVAPLTSAPQYRTWFSDLVDREKEFFADRYLIKRFDDYLSKPKESGYRGVHLVFEYKDDAHEIFNGLLIEVQFRTRLQHIWAMAVETVGMFYGQALKASLGDQGWLDFFRLASAAISHVERAPVVAEHAGKTFEQIRSELLHEGTEKTFFSKLAAIKEVDEKYSVEDYDYWLLELNIKKSENRIFGFKSDQIETAQEMYSAKEQTPACRRGDVQVVLVSTQSFKDLRQAYPSYFLDVAEFTKTIKKICLKGTVEG